MKERCNAVWFCEILKNFKDLFFGFYVYVRVQCLNGCMCTICVPDARGCQIMSHIL